MVGKSDREPRAAEERGDFPRRNQDVLSGGKVPQDRPDREIQGNREHGDRRDERHAESGSAPTLAAAENDDRCVNERIQSEERKARKNRNRPNGQEDEETGTRERERDGRWGHFPS